jgi:small-conductance mechanosensitive channel
MVETIDNFVSRGIGSMFDFFNRIPEEYRIYLTLGIFIVLITLYAIFVWKFYRFLGKRDLLELNLNRYNRTEHAFTNKFFAVVLFFVEYIIILPIVVFFWFIVIALMLLILAEDQTIGDILLKSAVIVGVVRIASYYKEDLARDLAKVFPFTILIFALLTPQSLDLQGMVSKIYLIPGLFSNILIYLFVIASLEFILRVVYLVMPPVNEGEEVAS